MGKGLVKLAEDMYAKFTGKTAPDRVGRRYGLAKPIATSLYAANGLAARVIVEKTRSILTAEDVPSGKWGVHIAFALKLNKALDAYSGMIPASIVEGFKKEYALKGADPAVLDKISLLFKPA